jgi:hypothetical protein
MPGLASVLSVCAVLLLVNACTKTAPAPLAHAHSSVDSLVGAVVAGFRSGDATRLAELAISEQEFRDHVWRGLPVSRPERNMPIDYVWADLAAKSRSHMALAQRRSLPAPMEVERVEFADGVTHYDGFSVHRKARLIIRTPDGTQSSLRLFGSVLEMDGRFKIFSYVTD